MRRDPETDPIENTTWAFIGISFLAFGIALMRCWFNQVV